MGPPVPSLRGAKCPPPPPVRAEIEPCELIQFAEPQTHTFGLQNKGKHQKHEETHRPASQPANQPGSQPARPASQPTSQPEIWPKKNKKPKKTKNPKNPKTKKKPKRQSLLCREILFYDL